MKKFASHNVDWAQIERFLQSAEKKIRSAQKIMSFDEEASLQTAREYLKVMRDDISARKP